MPKILSLTLTEAERAALVEARATHPKPYLRERAAALLKIADGQYYADVAAHGLLKPRCRQTVSTWLARYQQAGLKGLCVKAGGGRKPAFSPTTPDLGRRQRGTPTPRHARA